MAASRRRAVDVPEVAAQGASRSNPQPAPPRFYLPLNVAFYVCLISNGLAAAYAPIQDCDEVFNYWEPAHYLDHGYGLQTWEYSPEYSIRSWLYISLHALVGKIGSLFSQSKTAEFYTIRFALAFICAACETRLYSAISRTLNPRIGLLFLMIVAFGPGMFHASASFLPSSFAMYTSMLGLTAFLDWRGGQKTAEGITWFGIGAIVGWPFSGALVIPLLLEEVIIAAIARSMRTTFYSIADGVFRCLLVLGMTVGVDSLFFRRWAIVPWNIVSYNVFGGKGRGPDIFGTEPWAFYIRNLLLNFNVWFVLAVSTAPLLVLQALFRPHATSKQTLLRTVTFAAPFYTWLAIFTLQPHKEERFMYPAYPFLALNAAISFHMILSYIGSSNPKELIGRIPAKLKLAVVMSFILIAVNAGLLRIVGMVTAYNAPLRIYEPLQSQEIAKPGDFVCLGKEWYRFPSSFFLPNDMRAKFVKSEFQGLLPGEYPDAKSVQALLDGTSEIPRGMNDRNEEDPGKYTDISQCSFLVDSYFPGSTPSDLEPDYIHNEENWEKLSCRSFLDASRTSLLGRVIWIPDLPFLPDRYRRKWGEYCLLKRRDRDTGSGCDLDPATARRVDSCSGVDVPLYLIGIRNPFMSCNQRSRSASARDKDSQQMAVFDTRDPSSLLATVQTAGPRLDTHVEMGTAQIRSIPYGIGDAPSQPPRLNMENLVALVPQYLGEFHVKDVALVLLIINSCLWLVLAAFKKIKTPGYSQPSTPDLEKPASPLRAKSKIDRKPGKWIPSDFKRPCASPYPNWDVRTTKPIPYRPFRYGPKYFVTMGLRSMKWDEWIELDNHYPRYHADKARRIKERGEKCCKTAPEAMDGAIELLEELCSYLPERYPSMFKKTDVGIDNLFTGESFNIVQRPLPEDPMAMSARLVQDDLALMFEKEDGQYYLLAGAILLAGFWRLEDKFGTSLSKIHTSGDVPQFKEKLEKGMMNFFRRIRPEDPVLRNNYFLQVDDDLAWSHSIGREDSPEVSWNTAEKNRAIEHHYFRSERQSLRRLPRSGAVVFTIRTYFEPITEIVKEPYVPGRLASAIRSWGEDVSRYKGKEKYAEVLLEYLDRKHQEQLDAGLDLEKEDEVRSYPF